EPEGDILILMLTTDVQKLLPTIISRSQLIHFDTQDFSVRLANLIHVGIPESTATILTQLTQDSSQALEYYEKEEFSTMIKTIWEWFTYLQQKDDYSFIYVQKNIMPLASDRENASLLLDLLLLIYRDLLIL